MSNNTVQTTSNEIELPVRAETWSQALLNEEKRQARIDLTGVRVWLARTDSDWDSVASIRKAGFSRIKNSLEPDSWLDEIDRAAGSLTLLAGMDRNEPSATVRISDGRVRTLELERFVPLRAILGAEQLPAAQFGRFSAMKGPNRLNVMYGVLKAAWFWAVQERLAGVVISTPLWTKHIYEIMGFDDLGGQGRFLHPAAGNTAHHSMYLQVGKLAGPLRDAYHAPDLCKIENLD